MVPFDQLNVGTACGACWSTVSHHSSCVAGQGDLVIVRSSFGATDIGCFVVENGPERPVRGKKAPSHFGVYLRGRSAANEEEFFLNLFELRT